MIVAQLFRGPYDGEILTIPAPTETFVVVDSFEDLCVELFYLLAGRLTETTYAYLYGAD